MNNINVEGLKKFIKDEASNYPPFMLVEELLKYLDEKKLHGVEFNGSIMGFFVLDEEKFKSLYITPIFRSSTNLTLPAIYNQVKRMSNGYLTVAADPNNPRTIKHMKLNGFKNTKRKVQGKDRELEVWEWKAE